MPIEKEDILEVLRDPRLHRISFSVGLISINSDEYDMVADYIEAGGVTVVPGKAKEAKYTPQANTLRTMDGNPPLDLNTRTNALHECTHIISDINEYNISRLRDEAAAYLAQMTYVMLIDPSYDIPLRGIPKYDMMRLAMQLADKYKLGKPEGYNKSISPDDINDMEMAVHRVPEYDYDPKERLIADGVSLNDKQIAMVLSRMVSRLGDQLIADEVRDMVSTRFSYSAHENWVTSDSELITLLESYRRGNDSQRTAAFRKLLHIFFTVTQASASQLLPRLSTLRKGDPVSERFNSAFSAGDRVEVLQALQMPR